MEKETINISKETAELNDEDLKKVAGGATAYYICNECGYALRGFWYGSDPNSGICCPNCGNYILYKDLRNLIEYR